MNRSIKHALHRRPQPLAIRVLRRIILPHLNALCGQEFVVAVKLKTFNAKHGRRNNKIDLLYTMCLQFTHHFMEIRSLIVRLHYKVERIRGQGDKHIEERVHNRQRNVLNNG